MLCGAPRHTRVVYDVVNTSCPIAFQRFFMVYTVPSCGFARCYVIAGSRGLMVVDPGSRGAARAAARLIRQLNEVMGLTSLVVPHDLDETFQIADQVVEPRHPEARQPFARFHRDEAEIVHHALGQSGEVAVAQARATAQAYFKNLPDEAAFVAVMDRMNTAWGHVRESAGIREQPTVKHRATIIEVDDRAGGTRPVVQSPYHFSAAQSGVRRGAPWKGEHNNAVLRDWLELADAELGRWQDVLIGPE